VKKERGLSAPSGSPSYRQRGFRPLMAASAINAAAAAGSAIIMRGSGNGASRPRTLSLFIRQ